MLGAVPALQSTEIKEYIYSMQICPSSLHNSPSGQFGFIGSSYLAHNVCGQCFNKSPSSCCDASQGGGCVFSFLKYHQGHVAMTYTALATLITLGDDLSRVSRLAIISGNIVQRLFSRSVY